MKNILFNLVLIFCLIGCKKTSTANESNIKIISANVADFKLDSDSVKIVGEHILNGEYIGGKNEKYISTLMDSLGAENETSRQFYFKVFAKIVEQADGSVTKGIGSKALKYFEAYPTEFIQNSKLVNDINFKSMAFFAAEEIAISSENKSKAEEKFEKLKTETSKKCESLSAADKKKLNMFFDYMKLGLNE